MTNSPHRRRRWDNSCPRRPRPPHRSRRPRRPRRQRSQRRQRPSRVLLWCCSNDVGGDGSGGGRGSWHRFCALDDAGGRSNRRAEDGEQRKRIEGFGGDLEEL